MSAKTQYTKTYACTRCHQEVDSRDKLTVKKASFHPMGAKAKTLRSRVTHWLCPDCLRKDREWNLPPFTDPSEHPPEIDPAQLTIADA